MTDLWTAAWALTDSILVRTLALFAVIFLALFVLGLCRAAGRPMPPMTDAEADEQWDDYLATFGLTREDLRAAYKREDR